MKPNFFSGQLSLAATPVLEQAPAELEISEVKVKNILVAVDFSEGSRRALEYAVGLAKKLEAQIVLLHVFEGVPGGLKILEAAFVDTSFRDQAVQDLDKWQREVAAAGVAGKSVLRDAAAVHREIIDTAKSSKADLIVLGRHGRQGLGRLLASDIVAKVLPGAPCPVLVV